MTTTFHSVSTGTNTPIVYTVDDEQWNIGTGAFVATTGLVVAITSDKDQSRLQH